MTDRKTITIALTGNPNSGKTTVFNNLTGQRQHVGNYPGVTVELKEGRARCDERDVRVVDLPGTYSLTARTLDERVARDFIIKRQPDVVVDIVDASNIERNLYLATQLIELGVPLVVALNMSDAAKTAGIEFDLEKLSQLLGVPIVPTVGHKNQGTQDLLAAAVTTAEKRDSYHPVPVHYGPEIDSEIEKIEALLGQTRPDLLEQTPGRWLATKLLEGDQDVREKVEADGILSAVDESTAHLERMLGDHPEIVMADRRYGFISGACQEAIRSTIERRHNLSDQIDAILTHRVLGLPIFLALMYGVFEFTFTLGDPPMRWIELGTSWLGGVVSGWWPAGAENPLKSLLVDGIIGGVGGVIVFLPNILLLFLAIAVLEDTGYMARGAFIMDRLMHRIGLHGKSFVPMLIGFGCSVPAIMATRTLEGRRDRLTTMLVIPLISCGARLPIYALIIPAFFPGRWQGPMLWIIYVIGIAMAIGAARLLRATLFRGPSTPFVMELPPYRMPPFRSVLTHMWQRGWLYLRKAGTIILAVSIIMWFITSYPKKYGPDSDYAAAETHREQMAASPAQPSVQPEQSTQSEQLAYSIAGRVGHAIEPALKLMGFDWRIGTALIGAFAAKEVFVAQMGIVYSLGEVDQTSAALRDKLQANYSPLTAFCIMLFCLIGAPCMATVAITRSESGSWGWALLQWGGLTLLAFAVTTMVYQVGRLAGIGVG